MSESLAISRAVPRPGEGIHAAPLDTRRKLQLALGALWLLDGILQFQPSMFTKAFPDMLAGTSAGNPAFVASPVTWSAALITPSSRTLPGLSGCGAIPVRSLCGFGHKDARNAGRMSSRRRK